MKEESETSAAMQERPSRAIMLKAIGPKMVRTGEAFNVQSDGSAALWARAEHATHTTVIVWGETHLLTSVQNPGYVTACVPEELYSMPGKVGIYLLDTETGASSNRMIITVERGVYYRYVLGKAIHIYQRLRNHRSRRGVARTLNSAAKSLVGPRKESPGEDSTVSHSRLFLPYKEGEWGYVVLNHEHTDRSCSPRDLPVPPHHLLLGHADAKTFLDWGEQHFSNMARILEDSGHPVAPGQKILDFGCGSGRLIRWLCGVAEDSEIWGVDIRGGHILWCKQNLQPPFHFAVTTIVPHLPFEDNYFDLVYAGSVFTHIDDLVDSWLLELKRILKPNGRLYITIHDNTSISILKKEGREQPIGKLYHSIPQFLDYSSRDFAYFTLGRSDESQVFYDLNYFRTMAGRLFEILAVEQKAYGHQTAILMRKPAPLS